MRRWILRRPQRALLADSDLMLRALSLVVCLAHTATGWSIVPTTGQAPVARPRLVRAVPSVMVTPTTEMLAVAAAAPTTEMLAVAAAAPIPSALAAYGHYLSFMVCTACLTAERLTIKPAMNMAEEKVMAVADSAYGLASLLLVYTGYLRVTQYGKGWAFYQHEPIFWLKLTLLAVAGAASFFPTMIIIQRSVAQRNLNPSPSPSPSPSPNPSPSPSPSPDPNQAGWPG